MKPTLAHGALAALLRQLASAERKQVPAHEVVHILVRDSAYQPAAEALTQFATALQTTGSIATAMRGAPEVFGHAAASALTIAEARGQQAAVLDLLADDYEHLADAQLRLRSVLAWPATLAVLLGVLLVFVSIFVLPGFRELYESVGGEVPVTTGWVFAFARPDRPWMWIVLGVLLAAVAALIFGWLPRGLRVWAADALARAPFASGYYDLRLAHRLARAWAVCGQHAELRRAFDAHLGVTTDPPRNAAVLGALETAAAQGQGLAEACAAQPRLPEPVGLYVVLAERLHDWPATMAQLAGIAAREERAALARFERGLVLSSYAVLGVGVWITLTLVYLPIFRIGAVL